MINKIVTVVWEDTEDKLDWAKMEEVKKYRCPLIYSTGWLIEENKKFVKICMHDSEGEEYEKEVSTVSTIPRGMIKEVKVIWTKIKNGGK